MDSTTEESEEDKEDWSDVMRKRKSEEKRRMRKKRRENRKTECSTKAANMASLGPISWDSINYFRKAGRSPETAKTLAVKEFLQYNLNYTVEELEELDIVETRVSTKGDGIVNIAMSSEESIRELYIRKAETRNEDITLRSYIPPNFHKQFMYINKICTEKRAAEPLLKTQLRFGRRDIEVYIKTKDEEAGYKKVALEEFRH